MSDLKAQIAANVKGINLIKSLISEHNLLYIHKYMYAIQTTAVIAVRELLKSYYTRYNGKPLKAVDYMDDGTAIALQVTIAPDGSATFGFTGTGSQVYGNTNVSIAITYSAIIYCLRPLVLSDIPLNQGCLHPIEVIVPENSLLEPAKGVGVVGGNVLRSQRITDVILLAFRACAASQGCCNNLTFGTGGNDVVTNEHVKGFGYYKTIGGGSGAEPTWEGQSSVHSHMTNTHITDPEVFKKRYPCILRQSGLRSNSGGKGLHTGGDQMVRDIEFGVPVNCLILSERRSRNPWGLEGGTNGATGVNMMVKQIGNEERVINLGTKSTITLDAGHRVIINTPGGGGWGYPEEK
jgi:5-oxoprolinase (ATP-hydrolysing)